MEIRKSCKAFNDCYLRFQLKIITWPQSLDNTAAVVRFKKNPRNTIPQFSTQSFVCLGNLFKFPAMWNPKIWDSNLNKNFTVLVMVQWEIFSKVSFTGVNF